MSAKTIELLEQLKSLTILETSELVKQIETTFGVDASPRPILPTIYINKDETEPPEPVKTEFDVILEEVPADKKIAILKAVRNITFLGLKEAKDLVESAPVVVKEAIALDLAQEIKQHLESVGAKVSLK
ncbi:MAG TPA: 50S ribosomal protein L7/L12 [Cyanobacteria bacterium UBA11369]|nr:50S ribosomal protein L7/L12 [Cyanobacteria bacterium UBA11371]HBE33092.1 50S ribosomal protein L7/L12 [Cyanobacteria bacterium UBA11368]HBE47541.1 50S ribosomal protein L7/L12 [Cyanobacteria bacterium UBA11369]